jgi:hypothetical protein
MVERGSPRILGIEGHKVVKLLTDPDELSGLAKFAGDGDHHAGLRRVHDDGIIGALFGDGQGVKEHGGGIGAGLLADNFNLLASRPDFQLLVGGGPKSVCCAEQRMALWQEVHVVQEVLGLRAPRRLPYSALIGQVTRCHSARLGGLRPDGVHLPDLGG